MHRNKFYLNNYNDLKFLEDGISHFKMNGFIEGRKCSVKKLDVLPDYYVEKLKNINLLCLFDINPCDVFANHNFLVFHIYMIWN